MRQVVAHSRRPKRAEHKAWTCTADGLMRDLSMSEALVVVSFLVFFSPYWAHVIV